ncbi:MAG: TolC family protein [Xenococcaceae cyanobacterium MO_188.B32]|nr:TolC family protein [Xenococcaceae cyanobacterium MO_188.B32]
MSICAYLLAWQTIFSQPQLANDKINFVNFSVTENAERDYEIKDEFYPNNSWGLEQINTVQMSYNFSDLNSANSSNSLFLSPSKQTLNYVKNNDRKQVKSDNKCPVKTNISSLGSSPIVLAGLPSSKTTLIADAGSSPNYPNAQVTSSLKLSPEENPLVIPTKPKQVEIDKITPLTLEKAIEIAEANNRQLKITKLELEQAKSNLNARKAEWFPSVGLQSGLTRSQTPSAEVEEKVFGRGDFATTIIDNSVGVEFSLLSPQRQASIKIAREEVRFSELQVEDIRQRLRRTVAEAYYNLQQFDREVAIAEKDVTTRQQGVEIVQKLLDAALATRLDLLNAEVELDNAIQILRRARAQQLIDRRNIAQILSLPAEVTPTAADRVVIRELWDLSFAIAEQQYANFANQIRFEVEEAYFALPANLENVETATEALNRAEAAVEAAEIRFRANLNTQTEVLDARNRLVQAENNLVQAIIRYNRALANLQRAVGTTKIETNSAIQE